MDRNAPSADSFLGHGVARGPELEPAADVQITPRLVFALALIAVLAEWLVQALAWLEDRDGQRAGSRRHARVPSAEAPSGPTRIPRRSRGGPAHHVPVDAQRPASRRVPGRIIFIAQERAGAKDVGRDE
jgi:hypothetical protein